MGLFGKKRKKGIGGAVVSAYKKAVREVERQSKAEARMATMIPKRFVGVPVGDGASFPLGVLGLLPVTTSYSGGKEAVCYAFDADSALPVVQCIGEVNALLDSASQLSGHEFGVIDEIQCAVPSQGWGFCRAEYAPFTKSGNASKTPMKLYLETSTDMCSPGSYSGWVKYDKSGLIKQVEVTEWILPNLAYKMKATRAKGSLAVRLVSQCGIEEPLYKA